MFDGKDEGVRRILKLMIPALFGVSVSQINLLLDTVLASFLPTGSVSWLYYSDRLAELPLGVFGIAIATVILPNLSAHRAAAREDQFASTLDWAMRSVLLIGLPAALALILLAEPILITLFQYGALTPTDVDMASLSLRAYSLGLIAFMLIKILAPGYYARKDTATPVKIGIIAMAANMVMNLAFVLPLLWYFNVGHVGLALATSGVGLAQCRPFAARIIKARCVHLAAGLGRLYSEVVCRYQRNDGGCIAAGRGCRCVAGLELAAPVAGNITGLWRRYCGLLAGARPVWNAYAAPQGPRRCLIRVQACRQARLVTSELASHMVKLHVSATP